MMEMVIKGKQRLMSTRWQRRAMSVFMAVLCLVILISITAAPVFAAATPTVTVADDADLAGVSVLYKVIGWIAGWAAKLGLAVAFFGGIQTVLGFMNDDADSKTRGLKLMAAGFMLFGVCQAADMFFNV
ncbi:MAG: hypothetical protein PHS83_04450 [Clostridia bacterium]|nr:hypothetical protein [Clostridia bacterium]MDD4666029.1 hypothetical protein [Clostridia bacterium]